MVKSNKKLSLLDLVDVEFLQKFQDAFARATGVGVVTLDENGPITKPSNFASFCINTMKNIKGHEKCVDCDLRWGAIAAEKKEPIVYKCFAGLTVFVVPIIVEGNYIAAISGGLVFTQKPKEKIYKKLAQELGINEGKYIEEVNNVSIVSDEKIKAYADLLFIVANAISRIAHKRYILTKKAEEENLSRQIVEKIRATLDADEIKKYFIETVGSYFNADRCLFVDFDRETNKFLPFKLERLKSKEITTLIGFNTEKDFPEFCDKLRKKRNIVIKDLEKTLSRKSLLSYKATNSLKRSATKSDYGMVVEYKNQIMGILIIHFVKEKRVLSHKEFEFLKLLRDHAGTALYQADLYETAKQNAERERVIRTIIEKAISTENEEEIIKTIVTEEGKLFKADRCFFIEYGQELDTSLPIKEYAEYLSSDDIKTHVTRAPKRDEIINFLTQTKQNKMVAVANINKIDLPEPSKKMLIDDLGVKSYLIAPVFYGQIFYGSMVLHYVNNFMEFSQEQIDMAHLIANQFASVLYQAKLNMMNKVKAEREKVLRKIISTAISTFDFSKIRQLVTDIGKITKADRCYFVETNLDNFRGKPIDSNSEYRISEDIKSVVNYQFPEVDVRDFVELYINAKDLIVFDYENLQNMTNVKYDGIKKYSSLFDLKSGVGVPFIYEGKLIAVLCIEYIKNKILPTTDELDFLRLLGQQVGIAYTQIKLYNDSKKIAERELLLRKVIEAIRGSLDINEIIHTFVFEIGKILKAKKVFYSKYNKATNSLCTPDEKFEYRESESILKYCDMAEIFDNNFPTFANIIKTTKQRMTIPDISEFLKEKGLENSIDNESIKKYNFNAAIAFPIVSQDTLLGFYGIEYENATYLDEKTVDFLVILSEQSVIAMNQANIYIKEKQTAQREALLRGITEKIRSSLDIEEILSFICEETAKLFNVQRTSITVFPDSSNYEKFILRKEYTIDAKTQSYNNSHGQDFSKIAAYWGKKLIEAEPLLAFDDIEKADVPDYFKEVYSSAGAKALIGTAIRKGKDVWGTLVLTEYKKSRIWSEEEKKLLKSIANQVYIAINQAELFDKEKKTTEKEKVLRETTAVLRSTLDSEEIKKRFVEITCNYFNADRCIFEKFSEGAITELSFEKELLKTHEVNSLLDIDVYKKFPEFVRKVKNGRNIIIKDVEKTYARKKFSGYKSLETLHDEGIKSDYGMVVKYKYFYYGTLIMHFISKKKVLSHEEIDFLKAIVDQAGVAFHQAELFDKEKKSAEREVALRKILSLARTSLNIQDIKSAVIEETCKYFGADRGFFYELNENREPFINSEYVSSSLVNKMSEVSIDKVPVEYWNKVMFDGDFASGTFIVDLKKYIIENNLEGTLVDEHRKLFNIKTAIGLPISYANDIYGELIIQFTIKHYEISEQDKEFLKILADQFALTLSQAKLYDETKRKAEKENQLRKIYETMRSSLDLNIIKSTIVTEIGKALGADICFIINFKAEDDTFEIDEYSEYRSSNDEKSYIGYDLQSPSVKFFINALKSTKEIWSPNVDEYVVENNLEGTPEEGYLEEYNVKSGYGEAIYHSDDLLGYIIVIFTKTHKKLTKDEHEFLKIITTQAGITFHQAKLYKKIQKQAEREKINRNIIEILRSTFDKEYIKNIFVRTIGNFFKADRVFLSEYDPESGRYNPVTQGSEFLSSPNEKSFVGYDWSGPESAEYIEPLLNKKELNIQNWKEYINSNVKGQDFISLFEDANVKSSYNLPILYQERLMGYFCIEFTQNYFSMDDDDMTLIRSICRQCGIALYQAELYQKSQETGQPKFIKDYTDRIKEQLGEIIDLSQISPEQYEDPMILFEKINTLSKNLLEITNEIL